MNKTSDIVTFLYRHHFVRYLVVGGSTFVIDFTLLFLLHGKLGLRVAVATSLAYWVSITYNFLFTRHWTFSKRDLNDLHRHLATYMTLLGFNYLFTVIFVSVTSSKINYLVAKIIAVAIQMSWTYLIYKNVIFVSKNDVKAET